VPKPVEKVINKPMAPSISMVKTPSDNLAEEAAVLMELGKRASLHPSVDEALAG